jgi:signal transduction histidine kinase
MMRVVQPPAISLRLEDVVAIVHRALDQVIAESSASKIIVESHLSSKSLYTFASKDSLSEAIASILKNATQVCRPLDRIEVYCQEVEMGDGKQDFDVRFGRDEFGFESNYQTNTQIRLAIRDTGPGMSSETVERAWDLYYSGREHGRGLGISLANVKRIVDAHRGRIWIESAPDAGCAVEIRLPQCTDPGPMRRIVSI